MTGLEDALLKLFEDKNYKNFITYFTKWIANFKEDIVSNRQPQQHKSGNIFSVIEKMDTLSTFTAGLSGLPVGKRKAKRYTRRGNPDHFREKEGLGVW